MSRALGRPRTSSHRTIEEAAVELFLEHGYAATSVGDIARRAGVSRGTVFNYFPAKSDILWIDADDALARLESALRNGNPGAAETGATLAPDANGVQPDARSGLEAIFQAILRVAEHTDAGTVPLAVTQGELIGARDEIAASGLLRLARLASMLRGAICARTGWDRRDATAHLVAQIVAAALSSAWSSWARAGTGRLPLHEYVRNALDLIRRGTDAALDSR